VESFLKGGHDMDIHFVETNPRHNLPVLLALTDVWNDAFLDATARVVTPFSESLTGFPAFVGALEAQTCGRSFTDVRNDRPSCSSMILGGGLDGSLDRALYQSGKIVNSELVIGIDCQTDFNASRTIGAHGMDGVHMSQDALMCSFFAHADELAFGSKRHPSSVEHSFSPASASSHHTKPSELSRGNRPSVLLMCGKLDAFTCGQLVALSEHRAAVKAHLWGIDPFVRDGGSSLRLDRTDELKTELQKLFAADGDVDEEDGADDQHLFFSTKTLLSHYATIMRNQRS
jgi:glucose-6-phosphate isomerase